MRTEHGQPGQLNAYSLDIDDECTGFGKHKRCQVYGDPADTTLVEVTASDAPHLAHLPWPTVAQARRCANGERRVHEHGRLFARDVDPVIWKHPNGTERRTFEFDIA